MPAAKNGATTPDEYVEGLPEERREIVSAMRKVINDNLPAGFEERIAYGMLAWVVPHSLYPPGYHCDPKLPLGYMNLASQKNYISLHSMCLYGNNKELEWFQNEWPKHSTKKLNMGKGCIRFVKPEDVPLDLVGKLAARISPQQWIEIYEKMLKR
jgi:hypothetical protein